MTCTMDKWASLGDQVEESSAVDGDQTVPTTGDEEDRRLLQLLNRPLTRPNYVLPSHGAASGSQLQQDARLLYTELCHRLHVLPRRPYLQHLATGSDEAHLGCLAVDRLALAALCRSLAVNTSLLTLSLDTNCVRHHCVALVAAALADNATLTSLSLARNWLSGPGSRLLPALFAHNVTLNRLELSGCGLLELDAPPLAALLHASVTLYVLRLDDNWLADGCRHLAAALLDNHTLLELSLAGNGVHTPTARHLAAALRTNLGLRRLDLSRNGLDDQLARPLQQLVAANASLEQLDLSANRLGDISCRLVGHALRVNTTLQRLWLGRNRISPLGALTLVRSVAGMAAEGAAGGTLRLLCLQGTAVSSDFVSVIAQLPEDTLVTHGEVHTHMKLVQPRRDTKKRKK